MTGFVCVCDTASRFVVNTDTGLCTTNVCANDVDVCFNEAVCADDDDTATCQCRNDNLDDNCQTGVKYMMLSNCHVLL